MSEDERTSVEEDIAEQIGRGLESFAEDDRSFVCKNCGKNFEPAEEQFIFHDLCDDCFKKFNSQKMQGRSACISPKVPELPHFESSKKWSKAQDGFCRECGNQVYDREDLMDTKVWSDSDDLEISDEERRRLATTPIGELTEEEEDKGMTVVLSNYRATAYIWSCPECDTEHLDRVEEEKTY